LSTISSRWYSHYKKYVTYYTYPVDGEYVYTTCFRPDIGGAYEISLTASLLNTPSMCNVVHKSNVVVNCPSGAPDLSMITDMTVPVDRVRPTRAWLNATAVLPTATGALVYNWKVVYPTQLSTNPIDGVLLPVPTILDPHSSTASFIVPQSGVTYVIELSVSDHCHLTVKTINIQTPCPQVIPLNNKTLAAYYDGSVPVPLMSFAYDHTVEVANFISYPKCQTYNWVLVDYSIAYGDALLGSASTTAFAQTGGFAALISIVVIVAVIVPIIIWMYCTKKACFNKTDPRV